MEKSEYDTLINEEYICRIAFKGESHPYIAPFLYIFDGKFMYFLSTKYGKKLQHFKQNPSVTVEVEKYTPDLSNFAFVALSGRLEEVQDPELKKIVRQNFVEMIKKKNCNYSALPTKSLRIQTEVKRRRRTPLQAGGACEAPPHENEPC